MQVAKDTAFHLLGSFVGEGDGKDVAEIGGVSEGQLQIVLSQGIGLAGAGGGAIYFEGFWHAYMGGLCVKCLRHRHMIPQKYRIQKQFISTEPSPSEIGIIGKQDGPATTHLADN